MQEGLLIVGETSLPSRLPPISLKLTDCSHFVLHHLLAHATLASDAVVVSLGDTAAGSVVTALATAVAVDTAVVAVAAPANTVA